MPRIACRFDSSCGDVKHPEDFYRAKFHDEEVKPWSTSSFQHLKSLIRNGSLLSNEPELADVLTLQSLLHNSVTEIEVKEEDYDFCDIPERNDLVDGVDDDDREGDDFTIPTISEVVRKKKNFILILSSKWRRYIPENGKDSLASRIWLHSKWLNKQQLSGEVVLNTLQQLKYLILHIQEPAASADLQSYS